MSREMIDRLGIRTPAPMQPVGALSGGNQQKVLVGRWLLAESRILLLMTSHAASMWRPSTKSTN